MRTIYHVSYVLYQGRDSCCAASEVQSDVTSKEGEVDDRSQLSSELPGACKTQLLYSIYLHRYGPVLSDVCVCVCVCVPCIRDTVFSGCVCLERRSNKASHVQVTTQTNLYFKIV